MRPLPLQRGGDRTGGAAVGAARPHAAAASSPRSTKPTCSRPRGCGARWSSACCPPNSPMWASSTCWWMRRPCTCCSRPRDFDVIVTENMFGDILTDEASMLAGSMGLLPSASLGARRAADCSNPSTAPHRISPAAASPIPMRRYLSAAMLLRHSLRLETEASALEAAVCARSTRAFCPRTSPHRHEAGYDACRRRCGAAHFSGVAATCVRAAAARGAGSTTVRARRRRARAPPRDPRPGRRHPRCQPIRAAIPARSRRVSAPLPPFPHASCWPDARSNSRPRPSDSASVKHSSPVEKRPHRGLAAGELEAQHGAESACCRRAISWPG